MTLWLCIIVTLFFAPKLANGAESFWVLQGSGPVIDSALKECNR